MNKEDFAQFLEQPTREGLRSLLKSHTGEQDNLDFKGSWPTDTKLAKHILALANIGGGCLVVGVEEEGDIITPNGISKIQDKTDIFKSVKKFIPGNLSTSDDIQIFDFSYEATEYPKIKGKKFQVMVVENIPTKIPFVSPQDGENIKKNRIYTRRGAETIEASYEDIQRIISRRIETGYSATPEFELDIHLTQLKMLFEQIDKYHYYRRNGLLAGARTAITRNLAETFGEPVKSDNPNYPEEDYEQFVGKLIEKKKKKIEIELGVQNLT